MVLDTGSFDGKTPNSPSISEVHISVVLGIGKSFLTGNILDLPSMKQQKHTMKVMTQS